MTAPPPRRPWWRRKRTWAAWIALLLVAYPASVGPIAYGVERDWIDGQLFAATCAPAFNAVPPGSAARAEYARYLNWWLKLAGQHDAHREFWVFP